MDQAAYPMESSGSDMNSNNEIPQLGHGWPELTKQIFMIGLAVLLYFGVRGQTEGAEALALQHGRDVLDLETKLHLDWEMGLQSLVTPSRVLTTLGNWIYIWLHWPVMVLTLLYLHRSNRLEFLMLRNAMFVSGAIGLVIFISYPVAPPRMLDGFTDTVTDLSTSYRVLQPPNLVNKYAAVPSLHAGWNLLVGVAFYRASTHRTFLRVFGIVSAAAMAYAVVATANHYILDVVAGYAVALVGLAVSLAITVPIARRIPPLPGWRQRNVVKDHSVGTNLDQGADGGGVLSAPGEHGASTQESLSHGSGE